MDRNRAQELLPVIEAFAGGAHIEYREGPEFIWMLVKHPNFERQGEWRIKPEPTYRPFNSSELQSIIGKVVRHIDGTVLMIVGCHLERVYCEGRSIPASVLLQNYVFIGTGEPCGVKEQLQ